MKKHSLFQPGKSNKVDPKSIKALVEKQMAEAEKALTKSEDPMSELQNASQSSLSIFDANPESFAQVLCLMVKSLLNKISRVQGNKAQIDYIRNRLDAIYPTLTQLKNDPKTARMLEKSLRLFKDCMDECYDQIKSYTGKNWFKKIILADINKEQFNKLALMLNDVIAQLNFDLNVDQRQALLDLSSCQKKDRQDIMRDMSKIMEYEKESILEVKSLREERKRFSMNQKAFNGILAEQLEAIPLEMAKKLELSAEEQQIFFRTQFTLLNNQFQELHAAFVRPAKPAISKNLKIFFNDIIFDEIIVQGETGAIYKGEWRGAAVAVKKMGRNLTPDDYTCFVNELANLSKLRHPNIIRVYGACLEPEACLVMEYVSQGSLLEYLAVNNPTLPFRAKLANSLGHALCYLHVDQECIHRDINPMNILVDGNGSVKLSGFGLSKAMSHKVATVGGIFNKNRVNSQERLHQEWIAPELFEENTQAIRSTDVYAFGLTLYYLLTGKSLFQTVQTEQVVSAILNGDCRDNIEKNIPKEFQELIFSCVHLNPRFRPNATDVCSELTKIVELKFTTVNEVSVVVDLSPRSAYKKGEAHAQAGREKEAHDCYFHAAEAGYLSAQLQVGVTFLFGKGCNKDKKSAFYWFLQAANKEDVTAQYNAATMLEYGDGIDKDLNQALFWYEKAAAKGNADAKKKVISVQNKISQSSNAVKI